ncbi:MAG: hypothetical protein AB1757_19665 [Acidobacteriota bacterium]
MRRRIPKREDLIPSSNVRKTFAGLDPNELKDVIRNGLSMLALKDREEFVRTLESEMKRASLNLRAYLVPLGIPGRVPEDLTPTEVGHLIRFLKINVAQAMKAVERTMASFHIFDETLGSSKRKLAA